MVHSGILNKSHAADAALALIKNTSAVVKVVSCPVGNSKDLYYNINTLMFSSKSVTPKRISPFADRTKIWNTFTGQWQQRGVKRQRGMAKESSHPYYGYSKKTPVTLLQPDGRTLLFGYTHYVANYAVGFLFDLHKLKFKTDAQGNNKYIWPTNMRTKEAWWLYSDQQLSESHKSITLEALKSSLQIAVQQGKVLEHNEMLMCLHEEGLKAIFAPGDNILLRLNALRVQRIIEAYLEVDLPNIDLPILIITSTAAPKEYTPLMQFEDLLQQAQNCDPNAQALLLKVLEDLSIGEINQTDKAQQSLFTTAVTYKNWPIVQALLERKKGSTITNLHEILLAAIEKCDSKLFKALLDNVGHESIVRCIFKDSQGHCYTVFDIINKYNSANVRDSLEFSLARKHLCYAARINSVPLIRKHLATDVNSINSCDHERNSALIWAVRHKNLPMLQLLLTCMLNKRANFFYQNISKKRALHYALDYKICDLISACELIQFDRYAYSAILTALCKAVLTENRVLFNILIDSELLIAFKDDSMISNLIAAGFHGFEKPAAETCKWALENGYSLLAQQLIKGYPSQCLYGRIFREVLTYAIAHNPESHYDEIIPLLEKHAKHNSTTSFWVTQKLTQAAQLPDSFKEESEPLVMLP